MNFIALDIAYEILAGELGLGINFVKIALNHQLAVRSGKSDVKGILAAPPKLPPPSNKGLIRPY